MKLYLSSYKLGNKPERLSELFGVNKKIAIIPNALDFSNDRERVDNSIKEQSDALKNLGLTPQPLDLKKFFGKEKKLKQVLDSLGGVWIYGGNAFVLRVAYQLSGFDKIIQEYIKTRKDFVYAGFSAGVCVLQKSLKGLELVDNPDMVKTTYDREVIWDGVGIIDFAFAPHFDSEHPESEDINKLVKHYRDNNINYKALKDGEFIIIKQME